MKNYIFICRTIYNVGGAETYISNKIRHLKSLGYKVSVFFEAQPGDIKIPIFHEWKNNGVAWLGAEPGIIPSVVRDRISSKILAGITRDDTVFFECSTMVYGLWGEYLSQIIKGISIVYLLDEFFPIVSGNVKEFLKFKIENNLLFGINDSRIPLIFGNDPIAKNRGLLAVGCCSDLIDDKEIAELDQIKSDSKVILSLGRFNKPYFLPTLKGILNFIANNSKINFVLIFVGSSEDDSLNNQVRNLCVGISNLTPIFLGYLYPIPKVVFDKSDIAVASSGSAVVAYNQGVTTIDINYDDLKPKGFIGFSAKIERDANEDILCDMLEEVLCKNLHSSTHICKANKDDYNQHDKLLEMESTKYFDVLSKRFFCNHRLNGLIKPIIRLNPFLSTMSKKIISFIKWKRSHIGSFAPNKG